MPQHANTFPDVLVLVPGILGSVLARDNRDVWGFSRNALNALGATAALVKRLRVNARTARVYGVDLGRLPEGTYRITVGRGEGTGAADTVSDLVLVLTAS